MCFKFVVTNDLNTTYNKYVKKTNICSILFIIYSNVISDINKDLNITSIITFEMRQKKYFNLRFKYTTIKRYQKGFKIEHFTTYNDRFFKGKI